MKWLMTAAVCGVLGGLLLISGDGDNPTPDVGDVLAKCYAADRESKASILRELSTKSLTNDKAGDWWNEQATAKRIEDFTPFTDAVAEAIFAGKTADMASSLESN